MAYASWSQESEGRKRLIVLFPPPKVSMTLDGGSEPHSMAGCVGCQEEGVR